MKKKCKHDYRALIIVECKKCKKHWMTPLVYRSLKEVKR